MIATVPLARWNFGDRLVALLEDEHALVRKCAMYSLGKVRPDPRFSVFARDRLAGAAGTAAGQALATFALHAEPAERENVLFAFAVASDLFSVRTAAVRLLAEAGAERLLKRAINLLDFPPWVNWAYHIALLETAVPGTTKSARVAELIEVDNLHIAAAAARVHPAPK